MSRQKAKGNCFDQNSIAVYYKIEKYIKGLFILFPLLRILKISCYICVQYIDLFFGVFVQLFTVLLVFQNVVCSNIVMLLFL